MKEGTADKEPAAGLMAARPQAIGGLACPKGLDAVALAWLQTPARSWGPEFRRSGLFDQVEPDDRPSDATACLFGCASLKEGG